MSVQATRAIVDDILGEISQDEVLVVNPTSTVLESLVKDVTDRESMFELQVFGDEEKLKDAVDDFLIGSRLADLLNEDRCQIRLLEANEHNQLVVTENHVWSIITIGDSATLLSTTEQDFTSSAFHYYTDQWKEAEDFSFRKPPLTRVRETLREEFGADFESDLMEVLTTASANGEEPGLDAIEASILVAARHEELLYDISKWGEDTGVASKATFSRTKTRLEDADLITTEKVPLDVGRPRLRLMLTDELTNAPINELTWAAEEKLHSLTA